MRLGPEFFDKNQGKDFQRIFGYSLNDATNIRLQFYAVFHSPNMHTYICLYREVCLSSRGSCLGVLSGGFCLEGFVRGGFCPFPLLPEYIRCNRKLNITFNYRFHRYENNLKSVMSHALGPPLSQTVTPSRTPYPLKRDTLYGRPLKVRQMKLSTFLQLC